MKTKILLLFLSIFITIKSYSDTNDERDSRAINKRTATCGLLNELLGCITLNDVQSFSSCLTNTQHKMATLITNMDSGNVTVTANETSYTPEQIEQAEFTGINFAVCLEAAVVNTTSEVDTMELIKQCIKNHHTEINDILHC